MAQRIGRGKPTLRAEAKLLERWIRAKASRAEHRIVAAADAFANNGLVAPPLAAAKRQLQRVKKKISSLTKLTKKPAKKRAKKRASTIQIRSVSLKLPKGLSRQEALRLAKRYVRDFRGFTYNARTGKAVAT